MDKCTECQHFQKSCKERAMFLFKTLELSVKLGRHKLLMLVQEEMENLKVTSPKKLNCYLVTLQEENSRSDCLLGNL